MQKHQKFSFTLQEVFDGLNLYISTLEFKAIMHGDNLQVKSVTSKSKPAACDFNRNTSDQSFSRVTCPLCASHHRVSDCTKFKTKESIRLRVSQLRLCFNCLSDKHRVVDCPSKGTCRNCHRRHHTLICVSETPSYKFSNHVVTNSSNGKHHSSNGSSSDSPKPKHTHTNTSVGESKSSRTTPSTSSATNSKERNE